MAPGSGHKVSLTDQANGYVIADAIRLIATDEPEFNTATWTPNVTGQHEVYARWTANPNRATDAKYIVTHASGATEVTVNQKVNGGQYNLLGTFNLMAGSTITLSDNANGYVIADTIQLISVDPAPQQIYFMHTDHLNTPRAITNSTGQLVWAWANDDPFGANTPDENPSALGNFTCNLRLPGQYFDKETNLHYNYFRDYDAGIGRYVQSDPIGLAGGLNVYTYAAGAPTNFSDPFGLEVWIAGHIALSDIVGEFVSPPPLHLSLQLIPDNPADFSSVSGFTSLQNGQLITTLGGQAFGGPIWRNPPQGYLRGLQNYSGDTPANTPFRVRVSPPCGLSDTQFINALLTAAKSYSNNLPYHQYPSGGKGTYNSNSYVAGVLIAAGRRPPNLRLEPQLQAPGYERPVPLGNNLDCMCR